jgi:hypothetical protein
MQKSVRRGVTSKPMALKIDHGKRVQMYCIHYSALQNTSEGEISGAPTSRYLPTPSRQGVKRWLRR